MGFGERFESGNPGGIHDALHRHIRSLQRPVQNGRLRSRNGFQRIPTHRIHRSGPGFRRIDTDNGIRYQSVGNFRGHSRRFGIRRYARRHNQGTEFLQGTHAGVVDRQFALYRLRRQYIPNDPVRSRSHAGQRGADHGSQTLCEPDAFLGTAPDLGRTLVLPL